MQTLEEIKRQIDAYPHRYIFWTSKEIRALPEILDADERIKAVTSGIVNNSTWLAVCTDRRLIFLNRGMFYGLQQVQMPLNRVQSIDHQYTIVFGNISVFDGINVFSLHMVIKPSIAPFVKAVEDHLYAHRKMQAGSTASTTTSSSGQDIASQISRLAELKEKGYLTEAEFQAQKAKILS